jgi:hypothetical protein
MVRTAAMEVDLEASTTTEDTNKQPSGANHGPIDTLQDQVKKFLEDKAAKSKSTGNGSESVVTVNKTVDSTVPKKQFLLRMSICSLVMTLKV